MSRLTTLLALVLSLLLLGGCGGGSPQTIVSQVQFTSQPQSISVSPGQPFTLSVGVAGNVTSYQWYLNGAAINGATNAMYTVASASNINAGTYYVQVVADGITGNSSTVTVTVGSGQLYWTTQPLSQTVTSGSSVTLTAVASGATFSYQWYKGGSKLGGANSTTYTINPVTLLSQGDYYCYATAGNETIISNTAILTVKSQ